MTINLPIDAETERLARKLAEVSGKSLTEVVHDAIAAQAAAVGVDAVSETKVQRPAPGLGRGMITFIAADFDAPLDCMKEYM
jgi:Rv0623-like transcription factor